MTTPIEPGFYWYREMENMDWQVVDVDLYNQGFWVWFHGNEIEIGITELTGEWGPKIEPPDTDGELIETKEEYDARKTIGS